jgi:ribokinase
MKSISVVGSLNIDHILTVERLPAFGETISSINYELAEGGKGSNQAAALGKLGLEVHMFGKIGNDKFGQLLINSLSKANVNTKGLVIDPNEKTGAAFITVDKNGNNTIVLNPGANGSFNLEDIERFKNLIFKNDILLLQMEIPKEIVIYLINEARKLEKTILLNLAPPINIDNKTLNKLDYLIINETEMEFLTNIEFLENNLDIEIKSLRKIFHKNLIITLGPLGAAYSISNQNFEIVPTFNVVTVDKTAAGDAFIGGFIFGLVNNMNIKTCIEMGNANGSISTTTRGALKSLPDMNTFHNFLVKNGFKKSILNRI